MIRDFHDKIDLPIAQGIHSDNDLPDGCFPNLYQTNERGELIKNPLFMIRAVCESPEGRPAIMCFCKLQGELFLLIDHTVGTAEDRWKWLQEFKEWMAHEAWRNGLEQLTAWVPPNIDKSFAKRLKEMGFQKSPYECWTLNL